MTFLNTNINNYLTTALLLFVFLVSDISANQNDDVTEEVYADVSDDQIDNSQTSSAQESTFDVWEYQIEGNTILDSKDIEKAVYAFLGPEKSLDVVEQARTSLEERYRSRGYATVLVNIPEQNVDSGIIKLQVDEAVIDRVKVTGSRYFSNRRIKKLVPSLREDQVPNVKEIQEDLALLNSRSADRTITPVIRPGKTPGSVEMELKVKDNLPLHYTLEVNDRATADTTDYRVNTSISFNNLWQKEHGATLSFQTAPKDRDEVDVWSLNYLYKPEWSRNLFLFYAVDSNSDVATVGDLSVVGQGKIFGMRAIVPLSPAGDLYHNIIAGFDYKDFDDDIILGGLASDDLAQEVDYGVFTASYDGSLTSSETPTRFSIGTKFSMRGLFSTDNEFERKRVGTDPNFFIVNAGISKSFPISNLNLSTRVSGQFTGEPLISNEQFSMGGQSSVRGYLESDVLVDLGLVASTELQYQPLFVDSYDWLSFFQWYTFADWATGELREALPEQEDKFDLLGVGAGVRFTLWDFIEASAAWARPLKGTNATETNDDRMHISVKYRR